MTGTQAEATDAGGTDLAGEAEAAVPPQPDGRRMAAVDRVRSALPAWSFGGLVAVAFPVLLFGLGRFHWFMRDEWVFFTERRHLGMDALFDPFNVHPVAVPVAAYIGLWNVFGLESYRPYQAVVIGLHLAAAVLLRVIMRKAGVRPWLASVVAGSFVLFGPGSQNILWAFQIGFTGSLALGLLQLVLADHDGPFDRRDFLGVGAGLLAVMSTGVGVTMALIVGLALLGRRGWKIAALHTVPIAVAYGVWYLTQDPQPNNLFGDPSAETMVEWVGSGISGTFLAIGQNRVVALVWAAVVVGGGVLAGLTAWRSRTPADGRVVGSGAAGAAEPDVGGSLRRLAIPAAMLVGSVVFVTTTGWTRWSSGIDLARSSRYLHLGAALTLPALAVGAEALARRWRWAVPATALLLLSAVPANVRAFEPTFFGSKYMDERRRILTTAVRMPFAREVSPDVRPVPDPYDGDLTIGFLLDAHDQGRFPAYAWAVSPEVENEMRVRLGLLQRITGNLPAGCRESREPVDVRLDRGDRLVIAERVEISTTDGRRSTSPGVVFNHTQGIELRAELDDLHLRLEPVSGAQTLTLCDEA